MKFNTYKEWAEQPKEDNQTSHEAISIYEYIKE
jgi:hypothetical protein